MLYLVANIHLFYFFTVLFGLVPRRWRRGGAGVAPGGAGWRRLLCDDCFDSASIASCIALPAAGGLSRATGKPRVPSGPWALRAQLSAIRRYVYLTLPIIYLSF